MTDLFLRLSIKLGSSSRDIPVTDSHWSAPPLNLRHSKSEIDYFRFPHREDQFGVETWLSPSSAR